MCIWDLKSAGENTAPPDCKTIETKHIREPINALKDESVLGYKYSLTNQNSYYFLTLN